MSMQDNISDILNQIKLAQLANKKNLIVIHSNMIFNILNVFIKFGYIKNFYIIILEKKKYIKIYPKYFKKKGVITNIIRISKPSLRIYSNFSQLKINNSKLGITVISTSYGIMSNLEAIKKKIGGEIICSIY